MADNIGNVSTDQRKFTMVYHDFLDSDILDGKEKIIYILLKRYLELGSDKGQVFPKIQTLMNQSGMAKGTVTNIIKNLKNKGILQVKRRGLNKSNIYTLFDYADIWKCKSKEEVSMAIENNDIQKAAELLQKNGFEVIKKELKSETDQSTDLNPQNNQYCNSDNTISEPKSQATYGIFTRKMLQEIYDYDILKQDRPEQIGLFDSLLELILEVLNTSKKTERINQEDKPIDIVKSRFLKLNYMHLIYVVDEISKQTKEIKNIKAYQLTSLFNAYTTMELHYTNRVQHDLNQ